MRVVRIIWRLIALAIMTLALFCCWLAGLPFSAGSGPRRIRWRNRNFRAWARVALRILGVRRQVHGTRPSPPFLMACNHLGYIDIILLASVLDAVFIANSGVASWPVVGFLCRCMNTIFIDRDRKRDIPRVLEIMDRVQARGQGVIVFPEGTSSAGATVNRFHSSLLEAAARAGNPVWYASLGYATADGDLPAHLAVCWWGEISFPKHALTMLSLRRIEATVTFGAEPIRENERKRLGSRLRAAILDQFTPLVDLDQVAGTATEDPGGISPG